MNAGRLPALQSAEQRPGPGRRAGGEHAHHFPFRFFAPIPSAAGLRGRPGGRVGSWGYGFGLSMGSVAPRFFQSSPDRLDETSCTFPCE